MSVLNFLYCTITGVVALLLYVVFIGLVLSPVYGAMALYERLAESRPKMRYFAVKVLPMALFILFLAGAGSLVILAMHDWGCDIHGHPEHKILLKDEPSNKPVPHEGHKP